MEHKNMSLKSDINCILDTYELEVKNLIHEAKEMIEVIESGQDLDYPALEEQFLNLYSKNSLLDSCKEECIKEL